MSNARTDVDRKPAAGRPGSGRGGAWVAVTAAIAAAALGAGWYLGSGRRPAAGSAASRPAAKRAAKPIAVQVVRPSPGGIRRTSSQIGSVQPFQEAALFAKVSGYLSKLYVDYGDRVRSGQLLAEIEVPENLDELDRAAADVALSKANVADAEAQLDAAKAEGKAWARAVEQAQAEVDRYVSLRSYHEKKFARYRDLVERKAIPEAVADEEEENYESTRANEVASQKAVLHARAELDAAEARGRKAAADIDVAKAELKVAEARLARAQTFVDYMKILSPYDGVITHREFFPGAFIRSAAEGETVPLLTVARIDKVRVVTVVPDRDVPFADVGDDAEVVLDALPDRALKGKVSRFADSELPDSRTMYTEIDLPNSEGVLKPGMYGVATIILDESTRAVTLPDSALVGQPKAGEGEIFIVKKGVARKTKVKLGIDDGIRFEVTGGIDKDDLVILDPGAVSDGAAVKEEAQPPGTEAPNPTDPARAEPPNKPAPSPR